MKAHLIDTHFLVPRSRSSAKVKVKYQGHVSQKMGVLGALVFRKYILFISCLGYRKIFFRYFMVTSTTSENTKAYIHTLQLFPRTSYLGKMPHNQMEI